MKIAKEILNVFILQQQEKTQLFKVIPSASAIPTEGYLITT
jgi:hypothetical protein